MHVCGKDCTAALHNLNVCRLRWSAHSVAQMMLCTLLCSPALEQAGHS